jgi:hypothetical protein
VSALDPSPRNAATILRETPAPEDAGATTADLYDWQAIMATAHLLAAYVECLDDNGQLVAASDVALICEHHEDWALVASHSAEIVSAKHKEPAFGAFTTLRSLLTDGGLLHLYERWSALEMSPSCRLVTTAGLGGEAARLQVACKQLGQDPDAPNGTFEVVAKLSDAIDRCRTAGNSAPVPSESPAQLRRFLSRLTLQAGEPRREHIRHAAPSLYGRPVAECIGRPDAGQAVWDAVLILVRDRMRAAGPRSRGGLVQFNPEPELALEVRSLTVAQVDAVVRIASRNAGGFTPLPTFRPLNRMAVKMAEGGCHENAIQRAEVLRIDYRRRYARRSGLPSEEADRIRLQRLLLRVVDESTYAVVADGQQWGGPLWQAIGSRLDQLDGSPEALHLDSDTMLGGICDLANACRVWFSPRFDVSERLRAIKEQQ